MTSLLWQIFWFHFGLTGTKRILGICEIQAKKNAILLNKCRGVPIRFNDLSHEAKIGLFRADLLASVAVIEKFDSNKEHGPSLCLGKVLIANLCRKNASC